MRLHIRQSFFLSSTFLLLFFTLFCPNIASATFYYVATNGSDSNSGDKASPFQTIKKGVTALSAGDTLYVRTGTYTESILSWKTPIANGHSWDQPITVAAYPGDTVIITPPAGTAFFWINENAAKYLIIDGFIVDCQHMAWHGFKLHGGISRVRIANTEVRHAKYSSVLVTVTDTLGPTNPGYHEFIKMKVHHGGESTQDHGFYIETGHNLIEHSEIYANSGWGIHNYRSKYNFSNHNTYRYNMVHHNGLKGWACGIMLSSGEQGVAHNNFVYENPTGLCTLYRSTDNRFFNNLVFQNTTNGIYVGGGKENIRTGIYHNTVYANGDYGIFIGENAQGTEIINTIAYQNGTNIYLDPGQQTGTKSVNNLTTNPLFVNPKTNDFHLQAGSQAIDKGISINEIDYDHDGRKRPIGKTADIGAFESILDMEPPATPTDFKVLTSQ